jgi:copper chaperone
MYREYRLRHRACSILWWPVRRWHFGVGGEQFAIARTLAAAGLQSGRGVRQKKGEAMSEVTIKVEGMTCAGCVRNVSKVLKALPGVNGAHVSLERESATVEYDPEQVDAVTMRQAVEDAGFDAPA